MQAGFQSEVKLKQGAGQPAYPILSPGIPDPYLLLIDHPRFEADFQARVALHFGAGGVLGPVVAGSNPGSALFQQVADTFDAFGPAESARWGDAKRGENPPRGQSDFLNAIAGLRNNYLPDRNAIVIDNDGCYARVHGHRRRRHSLDIL